MPLKPSQKRSLRLANLLFRLFSNSISSNNNNNGGGGGSTTGLGVVSVLNISALSQEFETRPTSKHYVALFVAHESQIGYLAFGHGGELLLTSYSFVDCVPHLSTIPPCYFISSGGCPPHLHSTSWKFGRKSNS